MNGQKSERWLRCAFIAAVAVVAVVSVNALHRMRSRERACVWSSQGVLAATDVVDALPPQDDKKRMGLLTYARYLLRKFKKDPIKFMRFKQKIKKLLSLQPRKKGHSQ